jgi:predicted DNA-binding protein (UPF0251 family)
MTAKKRLAEIKKERGDLEHVIPLMVNELGQKDAAEKLGVSQATISRWLKAHNFEKRTFWEKAKQS